MIKMERDHDQFKTHSDLEMLRKNVRDLQEQLTNAYKRIDELNAELIDARRQQSVDLGRS